MAKEARAFSLRAIDAPILIVRLWSIETSSVSLLRFLFSSSHEESIFKRDDRNGRRADDRPAFLATEEILPARGARERVLRYIKGVLQYNITRKASRVPIREYYLSASSACFCETPSPQRDVRSVGQGRVWGRVDATLRWRGMPDSWSRLCTTRVYLAPGERSSRNLAR